MPFLPLSVLVVSHETAAALGTFLQKMKYNNRPKEFTIACIHACSITKKQLTDGMMEWPCKYFAFVSVGK